MNNFGIFPTGGENFNGWWQLLDAKGIYALIQDVQEKEDAEKRARNEALDKETKG